MLFHDTVCSKGVSETVAFFQQNYDQEVGPDSLLLVRFCDRRSNGLSVKTLSRRREPRGAV